MAEYEAQLFDGSLVTIEADSMQPEGSLVTFYKAIDGTRTLVAALSANNLIAVYDRRSNISIEVADEDEDDWKLELDQDE